MTRKYGGMVQADYEAKRQRRLNGCYRPDESDKLLARFIELGEWPTIAGGAISRPPTVQAVDASRVQLELALPLDDPKYLAACLDALKARLLPFTEQTAPPDQDTIQAACFQAMADARSHKGKPAEDRQAFRRVLALWCCDRLERDAHGTPLPGSKMKTINAFRSRVKECIQEAERQREKLAANCRAAAADPKSEWRQEAKALLLGQQDWQPFIDRLCKSMDQEDSNLIKCLEL